MEENPICPLCNKPMSNHSTPQNPFFVCEDCCCDENGVEVEYCEDCGEYSEWGYTCDCDEKCSICGEYIFNCMCDEDEDEEGD